MVDQKKIFPPPEIPKPKIVADDGQAVRPPQKIKSGETRLSFDQVLNNTFNRQVVGKYDSSFFVYKEFASSRFQGLIGIYRSADERNAIREFLSSAVDDYVSLWEEYSNRLKSNDQWPKVLAGFLSLVNNSNFLKSKNKKALSQIMEGTGVVSLEYFRTVILDSVDQCYEKIVNYKLRCLRDGRPFSEMKNKDSFAFEYLTLAFYENLLKDSEREGSAEPFNLRARKSTVMDDYLNGIDMTVAFGNAYQTVVGMDMTLNPDEEVLRKKNLSLENESVDFVCKGSIKNLKGVEKIPKILLHLSPDVLPAGEDWTAYLKYYLFTEAVGKYEGVEDLPSMANRSFVLESQRFGQEFEKRLYVSLCEKMLRIIFSEIVGLEQYLERKHPILNPEPSNYRNWMKLIEFFKQVDFDQLSRELRLSAGKKEIFTGAVSALDYLLSSKRVKKILK